MEKGSVLDMDQIRIEQLEVFAKHGAIPEENVLGQKFLVSAVLHTDTRKAGRSDQLDQTISYGRASKFMERFRGNIPSSSSKARPNNWRKNCCSCIRTA